jgi:UMF1 family MFS transporter
LTVALWWSLFSIPLLLFVRARTNPRTAGSAGALSAGFGDVLSALRWLRAHRTVALFLVAYWLYIDGVGTIARMAIDYGLALGFDERALIVALLVTQFVGFPAAIAFGRLGERIGARAGIGIGIAAYVVATFWSYFMTSTWEFYALAIVIGLVQGGVQSLSRSLYARMIPHANAGEFFGFYNMLGKLAAIVGPLAMGLTAVATGSSRASVLAVAALFVAGGLLLAFVDERHAAVDAD